MRFVESVEIAADVERVWAVHADVERWPEWTPSVTSARWLAPGPVGLLLGRTIRRYLRQEADGLRRRCERG